MIEMATSLQCIVTETSETNFYFTWFDSTVSELYLRTLPFSFRQRCNLNFHQGQLQMSLARIVKCSVRSKPSSHFGVSILSCTNLKLFIQLMLSVYHTLKTNRSIKANTYSLFYKGGK